MAAIQDKKQLSWEKETREACLGTAKPTTVDLTKEEGNSSVPGGAIAAMMSLLRSMIEHRKSDVKEARGERRFSPEILAPHTQSTEKFHSLRGCRGRWHYSKGSHRKNAGHPWVSKWGTSRSISMPINVLT